MIQLIDRAAELLRTLARCGLLICLACGGLLSQEPSATTPSGPQPAPPSTSSELVEGLLDLLNEPAASKSADSVSKPPLLPADVGLAGEDLGEASENPLLAVRQSMLIAAGYLRRDGAIAETMKLQADIVQRLDDLISEMERSRSSGDKSKSESEQQAARSKSQKEQPPQTLSPATNARAGDQQDSKEEQERSQRQGEPENPRNQRGSKGEVTVELSDPKALQQNVWGQLPARVRQQMQSRMVEQFLPAYRDQIEAYFRALIK